MINKSGIAPGSGRGVGTLNEKPLHESLRRWYARPEDRFEVPVDGFVVDIVRGDVLVEIQTKNFVAIRRKLERLLVGHKVRLVYPIPSLKWIMRQAEDGGAPISRRKSPKRAGMENAFAELVHIPGLLMNPNFSLELVLIEEEEVRRYDGIRGWRKGGWVTHERRLVKVLAQRVFDESNDVSALLPAVVPDPFTASDLAEALARPRRLAQEMAYCLRATGCITLVGKRGRAFLYARTGRSNAAVQV